jgi:DNA-binding transcriptional MerR regulator
MNPALYTIGEVSRMTGLSLKALRLYHENGLLTPTSVDSSSRYRSYSEKDVEKAQAIRALRDLSFSMEEIRAVLGAVDEGASLVDHLASVRLRLEQQASLARRAGDAVKALMEEEARARAYLRAPPPLVERNVSPTRVALIRLRGRYSDAATWFPALLRACGPNVLGPPMELFHEAEYVEEGADLSFCVPIREGFTPDGFGVEVLPETRALTLTHVGGWSSVGVSWSRLMAHAASRGERFTLPLREVYLSAPTSARAEQKTELVLPLEAVR